MEDVKVAMETKAVADTRTVMVAAKAVMQATRNGHTASKPSDPKGAVAVTTTDADGQPIRSGGTSSWVAMQPNRQASCGGKISRSP